MSTETNSNVRESKPWYRRRVTALRFSPKTQTIFASPTFFMNLPKKSVLNMPGNRYQPASLGDKFKKGPLTAARVVQKFFDRAGKGFARLSTGTIVATGDTRESLTGVAV